MRKIFVIIPVLIALVGAVFFSGVFDSRPTLPVSDGCRIYFTDKRPDPDDEDIVMCIPAAYTSDNGEIIGHYSTGGRRQGESDYRYTTIHLDSISCREEAY